MGGTRCSLRWIRWFPVFVCCVCVFFLFMDACPLAAADDSYYVHEDIGSKSKIRVKAPETVTLDVVKQAAEGINKMVGRSVCLTLEMAKRGVTILIVGDDDNIYDVPEHKDLYDERDAYTRVTIPGTVDNPVIVTRASDVMRTRGSDRYEMIYDFAKLFLEIGVKEGAPNTPKGAGDTEDTYDYYAHLEKAFEKAKEKKLWPNTGMTDSIEEYFAKATMVYYEVTPESADGKWSQDGGPVNTSAELKAYEYDLFKVLVEIYGEFEYISPYPDWVNTPVRPWFKHTQADNFGIDGSPLEPLKIAGVHLISDSEVEIVFNREVASLAEAESRASYRVSWTPYAAEGEAEAQEVTFRVSRYQWKTVTLTLRGDVVDDLYEGAVGTEYWGFTQKDLDEGGDYLKADGEVQVNPNALEKGQYVDMDHMAAVLNGNLSVQIVGNITDWAGNRVAGRKYDVVSKPWLGPVMRTPRAGVYVYADRAVEKSSVELAARYIDEILANETYGQKIADGITKLHAGLAIIAYGHHAYMQPGMRDVYGANSHQYLYVEGFGGGIAQTTESNVLRDKTFTRYDNEFILGHEFGHTIHLSGMEIYCPELYQEVEDTYEAVAGGKGLWGNSYAGSNVEEYFATLSDIWHGTMRESTDGTFNGTWGPVNTREELERYDIDGFNLMKKVYENGSETMFAGTAWESKMGPDIYDIDGSLRQTAAGGSSGGCNVGAGGAFLLLLALPLALRRK